MAKKHKQKSKSHDQPQPHQPARSSSSTNQPNDKKRRRSKSHDGQQSNGTANGAAAVSIVPHVIQWLEKRKKKVPDALLKTNYLSLTDADSVLCLLPSLRERERRALARHVEKCISQQNNGGNDEKKHELEGSDGEYAVNEEQKDGAGLKNSSGWPTNVEFSNNYRWDATVTKEIKDEYTPQPPAQSRLRASRLSNRVYFKRIADANHPAHGEYGLYCALDRAPPGSWLLDYVGHVMLGENQDKTSDYVSDFGERSELACDANGYGNEARFLNDFRNTGKHPNVEFNTRRDKNGELRQGVFVKLKKDAKDPDFNGVQRGEELLVSYGKSYWRSRVGNLTDFVWRLPGQSMPEGGKPPMATAAAGTI